MINLRFKQIAIAVLLVALLTLMYIKTKSMDFEKHSAITNNLLLFEQVDATLNQNILMARFSLLNNYDPIIRDISRIKKITSELRKDLHSTPFLDDTDTLAVFTALSKAIEDKERWIEKFKSKNAILENSLRYFPVAVSGLQKALVKGSKDSDKLRNIINALLGESASISFESGTEFKRNFKNLLDLLSDYKEKLEGEVKTWVDVVLQHGRIMAEGVEEVGELLNAVMSAPTTESSETLRNVYSLAYEKELRLANFYRLALFLISVLLLFFIIRILIQLRKSMVSLNQQKFAMDQHSIVSVSDMNWKITYANDKLVEVSQFSLEELLGQDQRKIDAGERNHEIFSEVEKIVSTGKVWKGEIISRKKDGSPYWVETTISPFTDESGTPYQYVTIRTNITERKLAEQNLAERVNHAEFNANVGAALTEGGPLREILQKCVELSVKHLDVSFARIWIFNQQEEMLELQASAGMYTHIDGPHSRVPLGKLKIGLIAQKRKPHLTNTVIGDPRVNDQDWARKEGMTAFAGYPLIVENRLAGVMAMFSKEVITEATFDTLGSVADEIALGIERKRAEKELARLAKAVEHAAETILITDVEGVINYVNPAFERITGYSRDEAIGKNPSFLKSGVHDNSFYKNMWGTITKGQVWSGRVTNRRKSGEQYKEESTISPITDHSGAVVGYVAVKKDVTEELKMERQAQQSQKMEAIGTLAGGIAHDFNNILTAIIGYAEMTAEGFPANSETRENLNEILHAGNRAKELVKQILAFSRQNDKTLKPLYPHLIVKESLRLLRATVPSTIEIIEDTDKSSGAILADATQLSQVIMNLCTNAEYVMRKTGGVLTISLKPVKVNAKLASAHNGLQEGSYVRLTVGDTGSGMDRKTLERIFEPFFTTKSQGEGTGMGLSAVHGIVASYGGAIVVESKIGQGTIFHVYLPQIKKDVSLGDETILDVERGEESVLFVDDEQSIALLGKKILERLGYKVVSSTSAQEALDIFLKAPEKFDIVITDQTMPEMTGFDLAGEIMRISPDMPIILCTGYSHTIDEEQARSIGIKEYVMKPIKTHELAKVIRRVLN